jgi:sensor histidine kinase YesM
MTTQLASLLRSSLDHQAPLVPLAEELRIVRNYLDIECVRFGDRLRYDISIESGAATAPVPRLSVQTLVENSVKYAVSPRREGGSIAIRAVTDNGHVSVRIADDGSGFDASSLPDGHGLALLRARLKRLFGDAAALRIRSEPGGTAVTIEVPARIVGDGGNAGGTTA